MFRDPCKRCLITACCQNPCETLIKRTNRWLKFAEFCRISVQFTITFLIVYLITNFFLTAIGGK